MWWLQALLFFVLAPGVLLTLPPGSKGVWMSRQTSLAAAAVHALVFAFVSHKVYNWVKSRNYEGFCAPDEVEVSGSCRKTCLEGNYNAGEKTCY